MTPLQASLFFIAVAVMLGSCAEPPDIRPRIRQRYDGPPLDRTWLRNVAIFAAIVASHWLLHLH